jgi:hypothetical protein
VQVLYQLIAGYSSIDGRSDVFAAGIVLFELVCARPLFHGKGKDVLEMVKSGALPRPRDFAPALPESPLAQSALALQAQLKYPCLKTR